MISPLPYRFKLVNRRTGTRDVVSTAEMPRFFSGDHASRARVSTVLFISPWRCFDDHCCNLESIWAVHSRNSR